MQYQQEKVLTAALFVYKARDGNNVFSDDSLSELCKLHEALTGHEQYTNYCLKRAGFVAAADDDESSSGASTSMRTTYCATGMTPLALFYGGASYDVDNLDMSAPLTMPSSARSTAHSPPTLQLPTWLTAACASARLRPC